MAWHGSGYDGERKRLREWWGITTREQWLHHLHRLLSCEASSPVWEFALGLRRALARDFGGYLDAGYWRQAAARVLRGTRSDSGVAISPADATATDPQPTAETEAQVAGVQRLIGRITRYEARMRADGILEDNLYVTSVDAWDLGRASKKWPAGGSVPASAPFKRPKLPSFRQGRIQPARTAPGKTSPRATSSAAVCTSTTKSSGTGTGRCSTRTRL